MHPLNEEQQGFRDATHFAEITWEDLTAAGTTQTLSPLNVANKMGVSVAGIIVAEAFVSSDAALVSTAITIGDGGSATRFLSSTELNAAGTTIWTKGGTLASTSCPYLYGTDDTVDVFFTSTGGTALNTHTAGKLLVYFRVADARQAPGGARD